MGARVDFVCFEDFVNDAHGPDSLAQPHSSRTMKPRFGCSLFFSGATWHLVYEISLLRLLRHVNYSRVAQPGAIAITSNNPTDQELTAMVQFNDVLTALAARESQNAHQCESEGLFHLIE
jgi:hypothetical protein